jgi:uncharacterized phosphosugar-binding protein
MVNELMPLGLQDDLGRKSDITPGDIFSLIAIYGLRQVEVAMRTVTKNKGEARISDRTALMYFIINRLQNGHTQ